MNRERRVSNEPIRLDEVVESNSPPKKTRVWKILWWTSLLALGLFLGLRSFVDATVQEMARPGWSQLNSGHWSLWALDANDNRYVLDNKLNHVGSDDTGFFVDLPAEWTDGGFGDPDLEIDSQNRIWVFWPGDHAGHTPAGLAVYKESVGWKVFESDNHRGSSPYTDLVIDNMDRAWVATVHGLAVIDAAQETRIFSFQGMGLPGTGVEDFERLA